MAEMSVRMTLSLTDTASVPLATFVGHMKGLQEATNRLGPRLEAIAKGITNIGNAVTGAKSVGDLAQKITALNEAMGSTARVGRTAASAIRSYGDGAGTASTRVGRLWSATTALGGALSKLTAPLDSVANGLGSLAGGAQTAAVSMGFMTRGMSGGLQEANEHASHLHRTMIGLAGLWASGKIKDGFVSSVTGAAEFEVAQNRGVNMGLSGQEQANLKSAAINASRAVPQFDRSETLKMGIDLKNAMNNIDAAIAVLPQMAQMAYNMKLGNVKFGKDEMVDVGKFLQQRNANDPDDMAKLQRETDMISKVVSYTQGRVDIKKLTQSIQAMRASGQTVETGFIPVLASLIEMSGGQNVQGATMFAAERYILGTVKNGMAAKEASRLGLINPDGLQWNSQGNINLKKSNLEMAGAALWQKNPYEWVKQFLMPALQRDGIGPGDTAAINRSVMKMFPTARAGDAITTMANQQRIIEGDILGTNRTLGNAEQYANNINTGQAKWDALTAKLRDLAIVVGERLLPFLKQVADVMGVMLDYGNAFVTNFPLTATFVAWGLAIAGVLVFLRSLMLVFGVAGTTITALLTGLRTAFLGTGAAVATSAAVSATAATGIAATVGGMAATVGRFFLRMIPWVGLLLVAWDLAPLLLNFTEFGRSVVTWANGFFDWLISKFKAGWKGVTDSFPFIGNAQAATPKSSGRSSGSWAIGSTVKWGAAQDQEQQNDREMRRLGPISKRPGGDLFDPAIEPGPRAGRARGARAAAGPRDRFANFDAELDKAKNALRLAEDQARRETESLDRQLKANEITVAEHFDRKLETLRRNVADEIRILELEKAAYEKQGDKAGVNRITTDIALKRSGLAGSEEKLELDRKQANADLDRQALELQRELLQVSGKRREAELTRLKNEIDAKNAPLVKNGKITQEEADAAKARAVAAIEYRQESEKLEEIRDEYNQKEAAVQLQVRNGTLSQTAAEEKLFRLRIEEAAQLDVLLPKLRELAILSGNDKALRDVDNMRAKNANVKGELSPADQQFNTTMGGAIKGGLGEMFSSVLRGTERAGSALKKFAEGVKNTFLDLIGKRLGDKLFEALFGNMFGGGSSGGGGGLSGLLGMGMKWLGGLFGGSTNQMPGAAPGTSTSAIFSGAYTGANSFAAGIDHVPGDMLANIHKGERVMTAKDNAKYTSFIDSMRNTQAPSAINVSFDKSMMNMRVRDLLDGHIQRELAHGR